jgi:peptidoglycan/xylan/chitin deacetylase (PgdA/CDA1 family)
MLHFLRAHLGLNSLFFAALALMVLIFTHFRGNDSGALVSSAMGETLTAQISRDVRDSINTLQESVSLRDWMTSGYTPSDVIGNVKSFNSPDANLALCEVLKGLQPSELSLFQDALKEEAMDSMAAKSLPCTASLINQIQSHWQDLVSAQIDTTGDIPTAMEVRKIPAGETEVDPTELNSGEFALVFEGNLDTPQTTQTLKVLQKSDVQAVFLIPGDSARGHTSLVKALVQAGETIGSQSTEEEDMTLLPTEVANKKLLEGAQSLTKVTGRSSKLFSFPLSEEDVALSPLQEFTRSKNMIQIMPNLDSEDWKTLDPKVLVQNIGALTAKSSKGIILLHSRLEQTALALPQILKNLSSQHRKLIIFKR